MAEQDQVFREEKKTEDFKFGANVVSVFDDMVTRSVPFYLEMQRMMTEIAADFAVPGTNIYDLGCSTGTTLANFDKLIPDDVSFVGIDESKDMLVKCRNNFESMGMQRKFELKALD